MNSNWYISDAPTNAEAGLHVVLTDEQAKQFLANQKEFVHRIYQQGWDGYALTNQNGVYAIHVYTQKAYDEDYMLHHGLCGDIIANDCINRFTFQGRTVIMRRSLANLVYLDKRRELTLPLLALILHDLDESGLLIQHNESEYTILQDMPLREAILEKFYDKQAETAKENMLRAITEVLAAGILPDVEPASPPDKTD